jgi:hypothetical protein
VCSPRPAKQRPGAWASPPARQVGDAGPVRRCATLLYRAIREAHSYQYHAQRCSGRFALLEWSAKGRGGVIRDGVDSYLIEDGWITAQSIHYAVISTDLSVTWTATDDR